MTDASFSHQVKSDQCRLCAVTVQRVKLFNHVLESPGTISNTHLPVTYCSNVTLLVISLLCALH